MTSLLVAQNTDNYLKVNKSETEENSISPDSQAAIRLQSMQKILNKRKGATVVSEQIDFTDKQIDEEGYPTAKALGLLIRDRFFSKKSDMKIKLVRGGSYTDRIYVISAIKGDIRQNIFFVKFSKKTESSLRLATIQQGYIGRKFVESYYAKEKLVAKEQLPIMTWIEHLFVYKNKISNQEQTIEISHAAHGQSIKSFLTNEENKAKFSACAYQFGLALGTFQQLFMNYNSSDNPINWDTVAHGDLHINNVFYDSLNQRIYFIDNETMQGSQPLYQDFLMALIWSKKMLSKDVYQEYLLYFFKGYVDSYKNKIHRQKQIVEYFLRPNFKILQPSGLEFCQYVINQIKDKDNYFKDDMLKSLYKNIFINNFENQPSTVQEYLEEVKKRLQDQIDNLLQAGIEQNEDEKIRKSVFLGAKLRDKDNKYSDSKVLPLLLRKKYDQALFDYLLHGAISDRNVYRLVASVEQGADLYSKDVDGITAFNKLVKLKNNEMLKAAQDANKQH